MKIRQYLRDITSAASGWALFGRKPTPALGRWGSCTPYLFALVWVVVSFASCDDRDEAYKDYIKDGEAVYLGKPHSVQAHPGNRRLKLSWWLTADPQVVETKVFWDDRRDSLEISIDNKGEPTEVSVSIDQLEERKYAFEIFTYDIKGNQSLRVEAVGEAFGDAYLNGLINRTLEDITLVDGEMNLSWGVLSGSAQTGMPIGVEINYIDAAGDERQQIVKISESKTVLPDVMLGSQLTYRTMFLPVPSAIDTFYSEMDVKDFPSYALLDKSKFKKVVLPTDNTTLYNASNKMENLWDDNTGTIYYTGAGSGMPTWFTFDLGLTSNLKRFIYNQRNSPASVRWGNHNARFFEIWGMADTPNPDGSWDGWTKLMGVESIKPSGLPLGQITDEDMEVLLKGEEFDFPKGIPAVRYLRIKVNGTWAETTSLHIAELTFWGN